MRLLWKGLILAAIQCLMVLSLTGKLLYDRATCPRVWVKTARYDPNLPLRGRYLALRLVETPGAPYAERTNGQLVLFFVPEHTIPLENLRSGQGMPEVWAEVTIPRAGPPRPIRLGIQRGGQMEGGGRRWFDAHDRCRDHRVHAGGGAGGRGSGASGGCGAADC